ncbi:MAG: EmrA/EmrK family multidrug efflux transporter periplasmic adaptor subunit [Sphingomonas sanxanigenens]|uniref:EmrA/EmrK family multidrug efflux transporter periplasmic adaptor subunit n=1 Tax=Sphingomonas sanxanigenens TaxID=397260 RepID=A0A2W5AAL6_9SPHN|nr:MAG: EmrA/EmrK family multidrug efflux transporter periplasmic adaptor subunit [Sphingomonas sanxanigenens]
MADQNPAAIVPDSDEADAARGARRKRLLTIFAAVLAIVAIGFGLWFLIFRAGRVSTDNAYVGAESAQVTPLVAGPVAEVRVSNTQAVKKGQILVIIDPADAQIALDQAQGALAQAEQRYNQAQGNADAAKARVAARDADIRQAQAQLVQANATFERARIDLSRRQALVSSGAVSGEELTTARAAFESARAARDQAQAAINAAKATQGSAGGDLDASEALVRGTTIRTAPDVVAARARLEQAKLDLSRTVIRAPIDGVVTSRQVQVGQRVAPGVAVMTIVPINAAYVDANYKENQLAKVRPGQPVKLTSDYYGGDVVYDGRVMGFAGGTGAAFALIPAQNATGNWIKVVQRLPVRIALDPKQLEEHPLRVGLSMEATIDTRSK